MEYVAYLHDLVSAYHEKLSEILSPNVAETFRGAAVDRIVKQLGLPQELIRSDYHQVIKSVAKDLGQQIEVTQIGNELVCEMICRYAHDVHPVLVSEKPQCPLASLVVGMARVKNPNARMVSNGLTGDGVKFRMRLEQTGQYNQ